MAVLNNDKIIQTSQTRVLEDDRELPGDFVDELSGRNLAFERYKRNHQNLELLFSPENVKDLQRPLLYKDIDEEKLKLVREHQVLFVLRVEGIGKGDCRDPNKSSKYC